MYDKTVWIDHIADPNTGEVLQQGTRFEQSKMNNIENGIYDAHTALQELDDAKVKEFAITLAADQWINNSYTIQNSLLTANTSGRLIMGVNSDQAFAELKAARISKSAVLSSGSLVISATGVVPASDINLVLQIKSTSTNEFIIDLPSDGGDADTLGKKEPTYFASKADYLALLQRIETAEENLNKKIDKNCSPQFFLPSSGWDENNQQTLSCDKFSIGSTIIPAYIMPESNIDACSKAGISIHSNTDTTITFSCSNVPSVDVVVGAMYQGDSDVTYEIIDEIGEKEVVWYTKEMLPDPHVLLLVNGEDDNHNDKSMYKNVITKKDYGSLSTIPDITSSSNTWSKFFKGNSCLCGKSTYWNKDHGFEISNINNFDPTKEWQISFSAGHRDLFNGASTPLATCLYFDGLGFGIKSYGYRELRLYYRNSDGTEAYTTMSVDNSKEYSFHVRMMYKQIEGIWNYIYEISTVDSSNVIITKNYSLPTKQITATDAFTLKYCGYAWTTISDIECGSYFCLDDIVLKDIVEDVYEIPKVNVREDGFPETTLTIIEHTSIINITDNTILRHNADGTVDKCTDVITPIPYVPTSNTIMLLNCDEMKATDECGNAVTYYENVSVDTENKVLGNGSFNVERIFKQTELGFQVITNKVVKNTSKITFECNLLLDINTYQTSLYKNIYLLKAWDKTNKNYYGFGLEFVYTSSSNKWELRLSVSESGTSFDSGAPTLHSFDEAEIFGKWIHLAVAIDLPNHRCKIYLDGVCVKDGAYSSYIPWNGNFNRFQIAYTNLTASSAIAFGGHIEEIRLIEGMLETFGNTKTEKEWVRI